MKLHLVRRQIASCGHQAAIFILCVALSMVTLVTLGSFSRSVHSSLQRDARTLHAADIIIRARSPFSATFVAAVAALERDKAIEAARIHEFDSVVRTLAGDRSLLSRLKVVEPGYPFYGEVELASKRPFREVLTAGSLVVEQGLLERLGLRAGDSLRVGEAVLVIRDIVIREPDRPVDIFSLGPRIFVAAADLEALQLVGQGSRVRHLILAKVREPNRLEEIVSVLRAASPEERIQIDSYRNATSRVKRFFDNFLFFLNLVGIFTLLVAGIGIQSILASLLLEQEKPIAVMKALGAKSSFIIRHYFATVLLLGLAGTLLGLTAGFLLQNQLPHLFREFLPEGISTTLSAMAVAEGVVIGFLVVALFTALPLYRLKEVKPRTILGKEEPGRAKSRSTWLIGGGVFLLFLPIVFLRLDRFRTGLYFLLGMGFLVLAGYFLATLILAFLRRRSPRNLALRQALKGLFRPRNATRSIVVTLSLALAVILSITLVEKNLEASFVQSFPEDTPNLFFLDIQRSQREDFLRELGIPAFAYPVVRGSVLAVNGEKIDPARERERRGDNLGREFNLTYRDHLLDNERLISGKSLFREDWDGVQVSVLDRVAEMRGMAVGDRIIFRIQGIPLEARVTSIRTRAETGLQPFFYFVFPERVLADAPQTLFAAARIAKDGIPALQNRIVARFPNISVIDVTQAVTVFAQLMEKLSVIVRFFTFFSLAAGMIIIVGSVLATRFARVRETVYYKILGARRAFVLTVFAAENLLLGLISSLLAILLSQAGSWLICRQGLDLNYRPFIGTSLLMAGAATAMIVAVGLGASLPILGYKPASFLREQTDE
ncbi:MAG: FtsX-like permease family protein [Desulfuromonadaceae bacterium]|nr:FtsX-like permease family protein [Desulfuromonadaceae bacterium]